MFFFFFLRPTDPEVSGADSQFSDFTAATPSMEMWHCLAQLRTDGVTASAQGTILGCQEGSISRTEPFQRTLGLRPCQRNPQLAIPSLAVASGGADSAGARAAAAHWRGR